MPDLPLSSLRVLDLGQVYAGPTCARILCDLGAEVIKIEGLNRIDITRNFAIYDNQTQDDYWNRSHYFLFRNAGKKSLTLDFQEPRSIELFKRLVPHTDVVGAGAVLTALHPRRRTGTGQHIDLSEQEAAIPVGGYALMDYALNDRERERIGNRSPWFAPPGCYPCRGA